MTAYVGLPWRSRFLRAPKAAFELLARADFVPLGELAKVSLGLKTGKDGFFFLKRAPAPTRKSAQGSLTSQRGTVRVVGYEDWTGNIAKADLLPAILNPHQFLEAGIRHFVVPRDADSLYLFARTAAPKGDLAEYIRLGERSRIHRGDLVQANASPQHWYRQSRAMVTARWALPYNSAYDYGALDNSVGAVLNGRFVGVDPLAGVESDLLGAVLASTYVLVARLLVGVATGVEGAFDVGPPAARTIMVPDVRRIPAKKGAAILEVLATMRVENRFPKSPTRTAEVEQLRHDLDLAVLGGLGETKGKASAIVGQLYQSYGRWRGAVEDIEMEMRANRRAMSRTGQSRSVKPTDLAARRVWEEMEAGVQLFPGYTGPVETVMLPRTLRMPMQESMIDPGVVEFDSGKRVDLGHHDRVRFAAMLLELDFEPPLTIPTEPTVARRTVDAYIAQRTRLRDEARHRATAYVTDTDSVATITTAVERLWIKKCRGTP